MFGFWYAYQSPTDQSQVELTKGVTVSDSGNVVTYAELSDADQLTFRDALDSQRAVVDTVSLDSLEHVDAVMLDGVVYRVTVDSGYRDSFAGYVGLLSFFVVSLGVMLLDEGLKVVDMELRSVFLGVLGIMIAAGLLWVVWVSFAPPFGSVETGVSTTPVSGSAVSDSNVIHVSSLSAAEQAAVYDVIEGGERGSSSSVSVTPVPELGPGVASEYEYVQSDSEYYALRTVSGYHAVWDVLTVVFFIVFGGAVAVGSVWKAYNTSYVRGRITV